MRFPLGPAGVGAIWGEVMELLRQISFASDARLVMAGGAALLLLAVVALAMERRRVKRRAIDRVGWVPWTPVFLAALLVGGTLLVMGLAGELSAAG